MTSKLTYRIFSDRETLHDYECDGVNDVNAADVLRRLIAMERAEDGCKKTDAFYEGMGNLELKDYNTIVDLVSQLPRIIASDFLINIHGELFVREEKFEEWNLIKCKLSPLWVIAGYFSTKLTSDIMNYHHLWMRFKLEATRQFKHTALLLPYIPDLDYLVKQTGGLNDLHIHLNGSSEADVVWCYILKHPYKTADDYEQIFYKNSSLRKQAEQLSFGFSPRLLLQRLLKAAELRKRLTELLYSQYTGIDVLGYSMEDELLFYILMLKSLRIHKNESIAKWFHYYMLLKGQIQSFVVMQQSQVGFSQFQMITDNTFRNRQEKHYEKRFLQLSSGSNKKYVRLIEGRFSPKLTVGDNCKIVSRIISGYSKACRKTNGLLDENGLVLIAHFIKRPERNSEKEHEVRNYYLRKDLKKRAVCMMTLIKNHPNLGKFIRGVDAAASEFDARPEVFAPTFSYLRKSGISHFTYHVGEDFCHLVSGLRAVYEAVEFLNLQSGDRLGHCTALGISPEMWIERNGSSCYLSRGEWLDDLVFMWYIVKKGFFSFSQSVMYNIERRIEELAEMIYGNVYHSHELAEAWLMRKFVPIEELNNYHPKYSEEFFLCNNSLRKFLSVDNTHRVSALWRMYHEGLRYKQNGLDARIPIGCRFQYDELIRIDSCEIFGVSELHQIQKVLLELLSEKNIIIEALPSSNLRISYYDNLREYHLKHWLNDDNKERLLPTVVLGSDDPGIFMTNIYNEYALAYEHLKQNKYVSSKRIEKIKYIHEQSEIYNFSDGRK